MTRVSTAELISSFDALTRRAESEIVTITVEGRDRLVLMSLEEFRRLTRGGAEAAPASSSTLTDAELPAAWGALRHTVLFVADDIAEPIDEDWKALR